LTVDKFNLMATPIVELALEDRVNDQSFIRNGNFYSAFWTNPAGVSCPVDLETTNANYWRVMPKGAAVTFKRSSEVPDLFSLWSAEIDGAPLVTDVYLDHWINGDLSATLRRVCAFSGRLLNNTGLSLIPMVEFWTCNAFNDFTQLTKRTDAALQTCANGVWTLVSAIVDLTAVTNMANGLAVRVHIPSGVLAAATKRVNFSRLKFQIGELVTEFVDDVSLFVTTPSIDSTMLQDGCIARPTLFTNTVIPSTAYGTKSIPETAIADKAVSSRCLATGAATANLGYTPVNKATDSGIGQHFYTLNTTVGVNSVSGAAVVVNLDSANASNDGYFPAISFNRPGVYARAVGLRKDGNLITVDHAGSSSRILDSGHGVDTASYQDKSITLQKLADSLVNILIAPGTIHLFAGPSPPAGWFVCDGTPVSRTTYAALFAAIGTYWGPGDNVNTFNLPDLRGRSPLGYVNSAGSGMTGRAFATRGGEENHTLSVGEMPSHAHNVYDPQHQHAMYDPAHTHGYSDPGHAHYLATTRMFGGSYVSGNNRNFVADGNDGSMYTDPRSVGITIANATTGVAVYATATNISIYANGSGSPHNTMPPFAVLYFIIKT
jgi:microcystin-dependent protein